jgi:hypothetical protein
MGASPGKFFLNLSMVVAADLKYLRFMGHGYRTVGDSMTPFDVLLSRRTALAITLGCAAGTVSAFALPPSAASAAEKGGKEGGGGNNNGGGGGKDDDHKPPKPCKKKPSCD